MSPIEERRDQRFQEATHAAMEEIRHLWRIPLENRIHPAYGTLNGYFERIMVNSADFWTPEQLAEMRMVLDGLKKALALSEASGQAQSD
jgi:hypothetical protein